MEFDARFGYRLGCGFLGLRPFGQVAVWCSRFGIGEARLGVGQGCVGLWGFW